MRYDDIPEKFNISTYLVEECNIKKGRKDKIALYYNDEVFTYGQVNKYLNKYANYLKGFGLKKGDIIGFYLRDCPEFVFLYLGAMKAGIIPAVINAKLETKSVDTIIKSTELKHLFTDDTLKENLNEIRDDSKYHMINIKGASMVEYSDEFEAENTLKSDLAFILFTSGSSGQPKGVMHDHSNIINAIDISGKYVMDTQESDIFYCQSSLSFAYGLGGTLYLPFANGASSVLSDDDSIYEIKNIIDKYNATEFIAVPSVYLSLIKLLPRDEKLFPSCRKFIASGEPLSRKLASEWKKVVGTDIYLCYGQTETLYLVFGHMDGEKYYGSLGKPLPGYEIKVLDEQGEQVKPYDIGHMFIKGKGMMLGYFKNEELTNKVMQDGWLATGDLVYYDEDGHLWYSRRNSDTFKVNGVWQSALPLEDIILENENVLEAVVSNEVSEETNSEIVAYLNVYDKNLCDETVSGIRKAFFQKKMRAFCPKRFYFVDSFPKGTTGKTKRGSVKEASIYYRV